MTKATARRGLLVLAVAVLVGGCAATVPPERSHDPAGGQSKLATIVLDHRGGTPRELVVRVGQRIAVASVPPFGVPVAVPPFGVPVAAPRVVIARASWTVEHCPRRARCFAFTAVGVGKGVVVAGTPSCLVVLGQRRCGVPLGAVATVYVEPRSCDGGAVSVTPIAPKRGPGPLSVTPLASSGAANRWWTYTLARFTDSDSAREPRVDSTLYGGQVDWGDGLSEGGSIVQPSARTFAFRASHFYCGAGVHTITVTIQKSGAASYDSGASATVRLRVTVARRP